MTAETRNWQELCEAATKEPDSERLMALVSELIEALDERKTTANAASEESAGTTLVETADHNECFLPCE